MNQMYSIIKYAYVSWFMFMFPYGFYRQWNSKLEAATDRIGHRLVSSLANGAIYISPFGLAKLFNQINRFDIEYNNLDKDKYKKAYEEAVGYSYRML